MVVRAKRLLTNSKSGRLTQKLRKSARFSRMLLCFYLRSFHQINQLLKYKGKFLTKIKVLQTFSSNKPLHQEVQQWTAHGKVNLLVRTNTLKLKMTSRRLVFKIKSHVFQRRDSKKFCANGIRIRVH